MRLCFVISRNVVLFNIHISHLVVQTLKSLTSKHNWYVCFLLDTYFSRTIHFWKEIEILGAVRSGFCH